MRISSGDRPNACSFSIISAGTDRPVSSVRVRSAAPVSKGCGTTVSSGLMRSAPVADSSTTKPPPTE